MTLIVMALDALDLGLVEEWNIENFKLNNYRKMETFSYTLEHPHTLEVWPSIATGKHPRDHGITVSSVSDWSNPLVDLASRVPLPAKVRVKGGSIMNRLGSDYSISEVNDNTFMDGELRAVHNWPGVSNGHILQELWDAMDEERKHIFERKVLGKTAEAFSWSKEMLNHNVELVAFHNHSLDAFGHAYTANSDDKVMEPVDGNGGLDELRKMYERVGEFVSDVEDELGENDDILILSDHGMNNKILDDERFGVHSFRAFASTTLDTNLPESVFDYKEFIEDNIEKTSIDGESLDMPKEQLRKLGYID